MGISLRCRAGAFVVTALIVAQAAFAAEPVHKGVDLWMTVAGRAQTSFADEPIPAGFFCPGSRAFTGTIAFKGVPLATSPSGSLGAIDTVVRRLDEAAFDDNGHATTRIQLMALSLASVEPIETSCGRYDVKASLAGEQPITTMRIFRTSALGGTYSAPLALNVKVTFTPVGGEPRARLELTRRIELGPADHSVWAYVNEARYARGVRIDTDGDGLPDTTLPEPSNFRPGIEPAINKGAVADPRAAEMLGCPPPTICPPGQCPYQACHCDPNGTNPLESGAGCDPTHLHCIWTCIAQTCCPW
jgi:hypothetical protein